MVVVAFAVLLAGCGSNEVDNTKETKERGSAKEETRLVTHIVTVEEPAPSKTPNEQDKVLEPTPPKTPNEQDTEVELTPPKTPTKQAARQEEGSPEDVLALQYEYINRGDFEQAYSLFAQQSRREVSLPQYRAFFEANAPYSVTDYSFLSVRTQGNSSSVDAAFTVNSAGGVEQLQRTQQLVRENGDWRVLMRPEQIEAFTATENASEQSTQKTNTTPKEEKKVEEPEREEEKQSEPIQLSGTSDQVTEPFDLRSGLATFRVSYESQTISGVGSISHISVWLIDAQGANVELLANEIVPVGQTWEGSKGVRARSGEYRLNVEAEGPWTVTIEQ